MLVRFFAFAFDAFVAPVEPGSTSGAIISFQIVHSFDLDIPGRSSDHIFDVVGFHGDRLFDLRSINILKFILGDQLILELLKWLWRRILSSQSDELIWGEISLTILNFLDISLFLDFCEFLPLFQGLSSFFLHGDDLVTS